MNFGFMHSTHTQIIINGSDVVGVKMKVLFKKQAA